jgi:hypothetical protein
MNESSDQEHEPDKGLAVVDSAIIEMLVENEPGIYISVDIVPIKSGNTIEYTMHKNWVNVYKGAVEGPTAFQFNKGAKAADLISVLIERMPINVNASDDMQAIRFIVSYAKSTFIINAIMLIGVDAVKPLSPDSGMNDGGALVTINVAANADDQAAPVALDDESENIRVEVENNANAAQAKPALIAVEEVAKVAQEEPALIAVEEVAKVAQEEPALIAVEEVAKVAQEEPALVAAEEKDAGLAQITNPPIPPKETYADVAANLTQDLPKPPTNDKNVALAAEQTAERAKRRAEADKRTADYEEDQRLKTKTAIDEAAKNEEVWKQDELKAIEAQKELDQKTAAEQSRLAEEAEVKQRQLDQDAEQKRLAEQQRSEYSKSRQQEKNLKEMTRKQKEQDKIAADNAWFDEEANRVAREKAAVETAKQQDAAMAAAAIAAEAEKKKLEYDKARQLKKEEIQRQVDAYKAREAAKKAEEDKVAAEKAAADAKAAAEKAAAEKAAAEKAAAEKAAAEKAAAEKAAAEKAAAEKAAAEKAAAEKAAKDAADKVAADTAARVAEAEKMKVEEERAALAARLAKEKEDNANRMMSAFLAKRNAQQEEVNDTWRDTVDNTPIATVETDTTNDDVELDSESVDDVVNPPAVVAATEESVEKLATSAQINENLKQISKALNSIVTAQSLTHKNVKSHINSILDAYNNLNNITQNNQNSDIDPILIELRKLLVVLTKEINGIIMYSPDQKTYIQMQSSEILNEIDNILRQFSNDESNVYPILPTRRQTDDVREERDKLRAAKPGSDELDDIEMFTNKVGEAVMPAKEVAKSSAPVFKPRSDVNLTNMPAPPVNATPSANPPLPPPAKAVTAKALTPRTNTARSNVFERLSQTETVASHIRTNEEQKQRKKIEAKHWADINARPHGGKSTQKKSRKSSHTKRHTKRAMPRKQQPKTRNKRTKRAHNQTRKK